MLLVPAEDIREELPAEPEGLFALCDACRPLPERLAAYAGTAQMVYIDPPYATGQTFYMNTGLMLGGGGEKLPSYSDPSNANDAETLLRAMAQQAYGLLKEDGVVCLHVDWRLAGRARKVLDEVFGEDRFLNEVIWAYQTGGRATTHFSRKHDNIYIYRKGKDYKFNLEAVAIMRSGTRSNHMKREVDPDGRVYRTIRSAGKIYKYYDDEPTYPGDVWDDLQMQQKDPQRTGFDTQKPLALLNRLVLALTDEGDTVVDLCAGSGTTLESAWRNKRFFIGVDKSEASLLCVRRRMAEAAMGIVTSDLTGIPPIEAVLNPGSCIGDIEVELMSIGGEDAVEAEGWAVGYEREGVFRPYAAAQKTRQKPSLVTKLALPMLEGDVIMRVSDKQGKTGYYRLPQA